MINIEHQISSKKQKRVKLRKPNTDGPEASKVQELFGRAATLKLGLTKRLKKDSEKIKAARREKGKLAIRMRRAAETQKQHEQRKKRDRENRKLQRHKKQFIASYDLETYMNAEEQRIQEFNSAFIHLRDRELEERANAITDEDE